MSTPPRKPYVKPFKKKLFEASFTTQPSGIMANNNVITSNTIQENPRVEKSGNQTLKMFSIDERTKFFDQYWSDEDLGGRRRKVFPIEYWKLTQLFKKTGEAAFLVKKIDNSNKVTGRWISFDKNNPPALKENDRCFVLSKPFFDGEIKRLNLPAKTHIIRGLASMNLTKGMPNILVTLLGKDDAGKYCAYLQNAVPQMFSEDPDGEYDTNPGGEGTSGVRVP